MPNHARRVENYNKLSERLRDISDVEMQEILKDGTPVGSSMGAYLLDIDGVKVFAKQIAISDLELKAQADNALSTANIYGLPTSFQYAFNSAGFGAGRELAAHEMTTNWVLRGDCPHFPLTYGYKMVDRVRKEGDFAPSEEDFAGVRKYWGDSAEVESRFRQLEAADKSVLVFMEAVPHTLSSYLHPKEGEARRPDVAKVESGIIETTDFMTHQGMGHFDAHGGNILVDDEGQVYFADFGMALSKDFTLSDEERKFLADNRGYDRSQALASLCRHPEDVEILPEVQELSDRYKILAAKFKEFSKAFRDDYSKSVRYPAEEFFFIEGIAALVDGKYDDARKAFVEAKKMGFSADKAEEALRDLSQDLGATKGIIAKQIINEVFADERVAAASRAI